MRPLTKKQANHFARIQSGVLIFNISGEEFSGSDASEKDIDLCYSEMEKRHNMLLRDNEHQLSTTQEILDYVRDKY